MKRITYIILSALIAVSCFNEDSLGYEVETAVEDFSVISPSVRHMWTAEMPVTRALVDNLTTQSMEANFLRIDEDIQNNEGLYTYLGLNNGASEEDKTTYSGKINWEKAKIVEASVISSPDKEGRRSVFLNPVQGYPMYVKTEGDNKITTYYHTRLVSWYPRTCELIKDPNTGLATDYVFDNYNNSMVSADPKASKYVIGENNSGDPDGTIKIRFTGLNGEKDVMVSDVVEAQHWHNDEDQDVICANNQKSNLHRLPLGQNDAKPAYENIMTYKHYMSAIKVNAYPSDVSQQTIGLWGKIKKVVVVNQPVECQVTLPVSVDAVTGKSEFGTATFLDSQLGEFDLVRTSMFGDDPNNDVRYVADEISTLDGYTQANPMKLGYALIAPDRGVVLDVHTDAGVYRVTIPSEYEYTTQDAGGNKTTETINLFEAGKIYDVTLKFETTNTIAAILLSDDGYKYFDLTAGKNYTSGDIQYFDYKHSNCYIIHPDIKVSGADTPSDASDDVYYNGFSFDATVIGNGEDGILPEFKINSAEVDPVSAGLIWESSYGLIQQVELLYGYVRFRIPDYQNKTGNAVIGVFDEKGDILWSWHIWIVDENPSEQTFQKGDVEIKVLDRNLGALIAASSSLDASNILDSYGLYYQWGRKDPSMGPPTYNYLPMSTATSDYYDGFGDLQQSAGVVNIARPTIKDGIQNPMYLILPTEWPSYYQFDWLYDRVDNLWGRNGYVEKTIFDPCPVGYKVPVDEINILLSNASVVESNGFGLNVSSESSDMIFLPYAGYKGVDRGMSSLTSAWKYAGQKGDYMSSKTLASNHRSRAYVSSAEGWKEVGTDGQIEVIYSGSNFYNDGANRRTAGSIRCVKDDYSLGTVQMDLVMDQDHYIDGEVLRGSFDSHITVFDLDKYVIDYAYGTNNADLSWERLLETKEPGTFNFNIECDEDTYLYLRLTAYVICGGSELTYQKIYSVQVYDYQTSDREFEGNSLLSYSEKCFTFSTLNNGYDLCVGSDGKTIQVYNDNVIDEGEVANYSFVLEDVQKTNEKGTYKNQATCRIKHRMTGRYLQRVNDQAGGVQLTENKSDATTFYLCSDWKNEQTTKVDILDENGNYLYVSDGLVVYCNTSYPSKDYKWSIKRVKDQDEYVSLSIEESRCATGQSINGSYSYSVTAGDVVKTLQYAKATGFDSMTEWQDVPSENVNWDDSKGEFVWNSTPSSDYATDLWIRIKLSWDAGAENLYSYAKCMYYPATLANSKYVPVTKYSSGMAEGKYYVFSFVNYSGAPNVADFNKFMVVEDGNTAVVRSIDGVYDADRNHIFTLTDLEAATMTANDGTPYENVVSCKLKHYSTGRYLKWSGSNGESPVTLVEDKDSATTLYLCPVTENGVANSAILIIAQQNYLFYTDGHYNAFWLNTSWNQNNNWINYKFVAHEIQIE